MQEFLANFVIKLPFRVLRLLINDIFYKAIYKPGLKALRGNRRR
jgi:hypothetical protein